MLYSEYANCKCILKAEEKVYCKSQDTMHTFRAEKDRQVVSAYRYIYRAEEVKYTEEVLYTCDHTGQKSQIVQEYTGEVLYTSMFTGQKR